MTMPDVAGWLSSVWIRALATGAGYVALAMVARASVSGVSRLVAAVTQGRPAWLDWDGWAFLGRMASTLAACGWLLGALSLGLLSPIDVGLPIAFPPWGHNRWLAISAEALGGVTLAWAAGWLIHRPRLPVWRAPSWDPRWEWPTHILAHEATLGLARAALAPAFGLAWASWLGAACKMMLAGHTLGGRRALTEAERRPWVWLDLALDWAASGAIVATGSIGWALAVRATGLGACLCLYAVLARRAASLPHMAT